MSKKIPRNKQSIVYPPILTNNNQKNIQLRNKSKQIFSHKKSNSFTYINNPNEINCTKSEVLNSFDLIQNNYSKHFNRNNSYALDLLDKHKIIDKESLKIKNQQLKTELNNVKKKLKNINIKNLLKDKEISKQEHLINKVLNIDKQAYKDCLSSLDNSNPNNSNNMNNYNNSLISRIISQYQELQKENIEKEKEIKILKKRVENSKKNELLIENSILVNQYNKYKNIYQYLIDKNKSYAKKLKNKNEIENEILKKNLTILQLQEKLKVTHAMNIRYENERYELMAKIKEYENANRNMKLKIKSLNQDYNDIRLAKKEIEDNYYIAYNELNKFEYNFNNINNISAFSNVKTNNYTSNIYYSNNNIMNSSNDNDIANISNTFNTYEDNHNINDKSTKNEINDKIDTNSAVKSIKLVKISPNKNDNIKNINKNKINHNSKIKNINEINEKIENDNNNNNNINTNVSEEITKATKKNKNKNDNNINTIDEENVGTNIESETNYKNNNNYINNTTNKKQNNNSENFSIEYNSENNSIKNKSPKKRLDNINNNNLDSKEKIKESFIDENYEISITKDELNENIDSENIRKYIINNNSDENPVKEDINNENINNNKSINNIMNENIINENIIDDNDINENDNENKRSKENEENINNINDLNDNKINNEEKIDNLNDKKDNNNFDVKLSTYILIKNFEACEITKDKCLSIIIKPFLKEIENNKQIEKKTLINLFTNKICESILIGEEKKADYEQIGIIVETLLTESKNDLSNFIENFTRLFDGIKNYNESKKQEDYIRQINIELSMHKDYFINSYDKKIIPFSTFRDLLNEKNIQLDNEIIEYLIYRMKKDCCDMNKRNNNKEFESISIFDLCYETLINLIR